MRIGEANLYNYNDFTKLLSNLNGAKPTKGLTQLLTPSTDKQTATLASGHTDLDDLLSGNLRNSYGVTGMDITGRRGSQKLISISSEMAEHVLKDAKAEFYNYNGMTGDNIAEHDAYFDKIHKYVSALKRSDRLSAVYTLEQLHFNITDVVSGAIREKDPTWKAGEPIDHAVLDDIFSDEKLTKSFTSGFRISGAPNSNGIDLTV